MNQKIRENLKKSKRYPHVKLEKASWLFKTIERDQVDTYTDFENELAGFLASFFIDKSGRLVEELKLFIDTQPDNANLVSYLRQNLQRLKSQTLLTRQDVSTLKEFYRELFDKSFDDGLQNSLILRLVGFDLVDRVNPATVESETYVENSTQKTKFYTENFVDRILEPQLIQAAEKNRLTESYIDDNITDNNYWAVLSGNLVIKNYHLGYLSALAALDVVTFEYKAVLDNRTTKICRSLDGQLFEVNPMLQKLKNYFSSDPSSSVNGMQFASRDYEDEVEAGNISRSELQDAGIPLPGSAHPNCRSSLVGSNGQVFTA